mgnify:CR=1 FL=1
MYIWFRARFRPLQISMIFKHADVVIQKGTARRQLPERVLGKAKKAKKALTKIDFALQ